MVGGEGRARGGGGEGAMVRSSGQRGGSVWEGEGVQGEGRGIGCEMLCAKVLRGIRGNARDQWDQADQRASREVGGCGDGPGAVGDACT